MGLALARVLPPHPSAPGQTEGRVMAVATDRLSLTGPGVQWPCSCWATGFQGTHGPSANSPCSVVFIRRQPESPARDQARFPQTPTRRRLGTHHRLPYSCEAVSFRRPASTTPQTPRARAAPLGRHPPGTQTRTCGDQVSPPTPARGKRAVQVSTQTFLGTRV